MGAFNLGEILVKFKSDTSELKQGTKDVKEMGEQTQTLGDKLSKGMKTAAVGLGVVGAGLALYAKNATDYTTDLVGSSKALARQIGVSTEEASRLSAALGRMGIDAQEASSMFGIFAKNITTATSQSEDNRLAAEKLNISIDKTKQAIAQTTAEIAKSGDSTGALHLKLRDLNNDLATQQNELKQSADAFAKIGVSTVDALGKQKSFTVILGEVADKFKEMPDGIDKTALSMELFGRSGKDMIKVLNLGADGIEDLEKQADALGLTLDSNTIGKIAELTKANKDLKQQTDALKIAVGTAAAPIMTEYKTALNDVLGALLGMDGPIRTVTVGILAFGGPTLAAASATLAFAANAVAAGPALLKMANAVRVTTAAQWLYNAALAANPIGLVIIAIAAFVGALVLLYFNLDKVRNFFQTDWGIAIAVALATMVPFIGLPLLIITQWDTVRLWMEGFWIGLQTGAANAYNFIVNLWQGIFGFFDAIGHGIVDAFKTAINFVIMLANKAISGFNATVGKLPGGPNIGKIPGFEKGTKGFAGGAAIVGEGGPELGLFPSRTQIIPNNMTSNLVDNLMNVGDMLKAFMSNSMASFLPANQMALANAGSAGSIHSETNIYGNINIASQADSDYFFNRMDRNSQLASMGGGTINPPGAP